MNKEKLRKIDALVAEKVMGWRLDERGYGATFWVDENGKVKRAAEPCSIDFCSCEVFSPSTEISDAWKVVEKLYKTKGLRMFIGLQFPPLVMARVMDDVGDWIGHGVDEETAPLAICLAALKAIGVDIEKF